MIASLAQVAAGVVGEPDVAHVLAGLTAACCEELEAGAVALMAYDETGRLGMLSATSHRAVELEMLQIQRTTGPCVECIETGSGFEVLGVDAIIDRWDDVGRAIGAAGFDAVAAFPMRWHGRSFGGLNVFGSADTWSATDPDDRQRLGGVFADIATLALVAAVPESLERVAQSLHAALADRTVIEQAKGVLAYRDRLDLDAAYDALRRRSLESGTSLTRVAHDVVDLQQRV